jgi:hypothetical protein
LNRVRVVGRLAVVNEKGSMLLGPTILLGAILIGTTLLQISGYRYRETMNKLNVSARAGYAATAGFNDGLNWFRHQLIQPVGSALIPGTTQPNEAFNPKQASGETLDASIGLVKEYPVSSANSLWVRYEIPRLPSPGTIEGARDITGMRTDTQSDGQGIAWSIGSVAYVYLRKDASVPFNQGPNHIISRARAYGEIRKLSLVLPIDAAVIVANQDDAVVRNHTHLLGGTNPGLAYYTGSGANVDSSAEITDAPRQIPPEVSTALSPQTIFDADLSTLRQMADGMLAGSQTTALPFGEMSFTYIEGDTTFNSARPLRGSGLLIVHGNLMAASGANTYFTGLIFVTGNVSISGAGQVTGALVTQGDLVLDSGGDTLDVLYDQTVLNTVRQQIGQYRVSKKPQIQTLASR